MNKTQTLLISATLNLILLGALFLSDNKPKTVNQENEVIGSSNTVSQMTLGSTDLKRAKPTTKAAPRQIEIAGRQYVRMPEKYRRLFGHRVFYGSPGQWRLGPCATTSLNLSDSAAAMVAKQLNDAFAKALTNENALLLEWEFDPATGSLQTNIPPLTEEVEEFGRASVAILENYVDKSTAQFLSSLLLGDKLPQERNQAWTVTLSQDAKGLRLVRRIWEEVDGKQKSVGETSMHRTPPFETDGPLRALNLSGLFQQLSQSSLN